MGWSCIYQSFSSAREKKDYLDSTFKWSNNSNEIIKSAMVGSTYYAAVKDNNTGEVWALISLTSNNSKKNEFCYKDMSESAGPVESKCPAGILNLLTPTTNEYALRWRERCRENLKSKTSGNSISVGQKFLFTDFWSCHGVAQIVFKIKSSFVFENNSSRFKLSSALFREGLRLGTIKRV